MPNLPVRNMGGAGIVSDIHPYDLPPNALSAGVNIRFENGKIARGPVMRRVYEYEDTFEPVYCFSIPPISNGAESIIAVNATGEKIVSVTGSTIEDLTPDDNDVGNIEDSYTHTFLGNVAYLNRRSFLPLQKRPADLKFAPLTAWDEDWRCGALRSYKDFLIALNVRKGAVEYPTMVKWSDVAGFGSPPASWDETSTTNSAGENILNEMREPIIDGLSLRDSFIIYGSSEVWIMDYIAGNFLFRFRKLYESVGVLNQNCVVQVDGLHYVFDRNDIWVHDGATKKSIIHGLNKDYLFESLVSKHIDKCFVSHDPRLNEIHFCYPSGDRLTGFRNPETGCNRAAVYNYRRETWTFYDLPNVTGACLSSIASGETYTTVPDVSYEEIGGNYLATDDEEQRHAIFVGRISPDQGLTKNRIYGLDLLTGGRLVKPIDYEALKPAFGERIGIDIDEQGVPLNNYKAIHAMFPQLEIEGQTNVEFQFGASHVSTGQPPWGERIAFDPRNETQVDVREAGRYLAYRFYYDGIGDFGFSGLDARVVIRGKQ